MEQQTEQNARSEPKARSDTTGEAGVSAPLRILACRISLPNHVWRANGKRLIIGIGNTRHKAGLENTTIREFMDDFQLTTDDLGITKAFIDTFVWYYASSDKLSWVLWV